MASSRMLLGFGLAALAAVSPAHAQSAMVVLQWPGLILGVLRDSTLGVVVQARPDDSYSRSLFVAWFTPTEAAEWARQADSLIRTTPPSSRGGPPLILSDDIGSLLALRSDSGSRFHLTFQPGEAQKPFTADVSAAQVSTLSRVIASAAERSMRQPGAGPPTATDRNGVVYWIRAADLGATEPKPRRFAKPRYPFDFQIHGMPGRVFVRYVIDTRGDAEPGSIEVLWASHPDFGKAAVEALTNSHFRPGTVQGRSVRTGVLQLISWQVGS